MAGMENMGSLFSSVNIGGLLGTLGSIAQIFVIVLVLGGIGFAFLMYSKYSTRVILLRQRGKSTEYLMRKAFRNTKRGVYDVKVKSMLAPGKKIPLPPNDELIAKSGKNDVIILRELADGSLRYCDHPDVSGATFKTLSADYREFDLLDAEATKSRYSKLGFWREHGSSIILLIMVVLFFVLGLMLLKNMQGVSDTLAGAMANYNVLRAPQIIGGNMTG